MTFAILFRMFFFFFRSNFSGIMFSLFWRGKVKNHFCKLLREFDIDVDESKRIMLLLLSLCDSILVDKLLFEMIFVLMMTMIVEPTTAEAWKKPGCHKIGHTRTISIPDCVDIRVTTNACRGYCQSWSVPSAVETLLTSPSRPITSVGQCCNIMETEDVSVSVLCLDGHRNVTFKSAVSCSCYHCKKE